MVQLDVQGAAGLADRNRCVEAAVLDAQLVELTQRRTREPAEFRVVALAFEFRDDHQGQDDLVLVEPGQGPRVGQQHGGVEHVAAGRSARRGVDALRDEGGATVGHGCSLWTRHHAQLSGGPAGP